MSERAASFPSINYKSVLLIAAVVIGGLWLVKKLSGGVAAITGSVVNPLADFYVYLTSQGAMIPSGIVLLPNGTTLPVAQAAPRTVPNSNSASFVYAGTTYYLNTPSDANGNWAASLTLGG
jgi:hypothetical protein